MTINEGSKKLLPVYILEVLKKHTDSDHILTRQSIVDRIQNDYGMSCDVRTITRNVNLLCDSGYPISRYEDNGKGFYLYQRDFEESEIRLLTDAVLASKHIAKNQTNGLIDKLCSLSTIHFKKKNRIIYSTDNYSIRYNQNLFYNIEKINDAIESKKQISLMYNAFDINKSLKPRYRENCIVNPYHMLMNNGRYYLMANFPRHSNMAFLRLDYITDVEEVDRVVRPIEEIENYENGINLTELRTNYPYMFSGENVKAKFKTDAKMVGDFIDWFGDKIIISECDDGIIVRLTANRNAIIYWSLQYGRRVELIEPADLREEIKQNLEKILSKYSK
ncbi:MAG: WYL domain-containing protein [Clostridiales bacterium]|nr:WYL domain-containing protein [Clostridiales bacterium]